MIARKVSLSLVLALACALSTPIASAQQQPSTAELKKDIEELKDGLKAMQKDLQDIKALLQRGGQAAPQNVVLELAGHPSKGDRNAKLTFVEFVDYQ
jgi:protein-disulfide isomerase